MLNQHCLEAEEEEEVENTPIAIGCIPVAQIPNILTPTTPPLVHSPASSSVASITLFNLDDGERTIQAVEHQCKYVELVNSYPLK